MFGQFPLLSRSGTLARLIGELKKGNDDEDSTAENGEESSLKATTLLNLHHLPGGERSFEIVSKFCYGIKVEICAENLVAVRCAAEELEMTEEYGEDNLITQAESFLRKLVGNWNDTLHVLNTCQQDDLLLGAEKLQIVTRCIHSLAVKVSSDRTPYGFCPADIGPDWWYEDVSSLNLSMYKRFISEANTRGMPSELVAESLVFYATRHLPGLQKYANSSSSSLSLPSSTATTTISSADQRILLEEIVSMLPAEKGVATTKLLLTFLHSSMILHAGESCRENLEKRVGAQLYEAALEDLFLIRNMDYSGGDTMFYDVECIQRILGHFMLSEKMAVINQVGEDGVGEVMGITSPTSESHMATVGRLVDGYLAQVAPDVNLKFDIFQPLAATIPEHARTSDDDFYHAIDIYLKSHPNLSGSQLEQLCGLINCQKLSLEACTHAAQNEKLPLRMAVQILFFEQLRLRTSIASWFFVSDNLESRCNSNAMELEKRGEEKSVDEMRIRLMKLEKECTDIKQEMTNMGKVKRSWTTLPKRVLSMRLKGNARARSFCSGDETPVDCYKDKKINGDSKMKKKK